MKVLLIENKWLAHIFDTAYQTALHWASKRGYLEIMKALIENGAYVDARDIIGRTPLMLAAKANKS